MSEQQPPETTEPKIHGLLLDRPDIEQLREGFLTGCVKIVERGDRLPDVLMELVAREVGLPNSYYLPEEETGVGKLE